MVSLNERHVCFDMSRYIRELRRWHVEDDWPRQRQEALAPLPVDSATPVLALRVPALRK